MKIITHQKNITATERVIGLVMGLLFLGKSTKLGKATKLLSRMTGLGLLARSATGHSWLYQTQRMRNFRIPLKSSFSVMGTPEALFHIFTSLEQLNPALKNLRFVPRTTQSQVPHQFQYKWYFGPRNQQLYFGEIRLEIDETNYEIIFWSDPEERIPADGRLKLTPRYATSNGKHHGSTLEVSLRYHPPLGILALITQPLLKKAGDFLIREELRRVKQFLETGEVATIEGQSSGRDKKFPQTFKSQYPIQEDEKRRSA